MTVTPRYIRFEVIDLFVFQKFIKIFFKLNFIFWSRTFLNYCGQARHPWHLMSPVFGYSAFQDKPVISDPAHAGI